MGKQSDTLQAKVKIGSTWTDAELIPASVADLKEVTFTGAPRTVPTYVQGKQGIGVFVPCEASPAKGTTTVSGRGVPSSLSLVQGLRSDLPIAELSSALEILHSRLKLDGLLFGRMALITLGKKLEDFPETEHQAVNRLLRAVRLRVERLSSEPTANN